MKNIAVFFILVILLTGCFESEKLPENEYSYMTIIYQTPEENEILPTDEIVFRFSMPLSEDAVEKIETSFETSVTITTNEIILSNLPTAESLLVTLNRGIKSTDGHPLVYKTNDGGYISEEKDFVYTTKADSPEAVQFLPGKSTITSSMAIRFSEPVKTVGEISPIPNKTILESDILFLYYETSPQTVTLKNALTKNDESFKELVMEKTVDWKKPDEPYEIKETITDSYYVFTVTGDEIIAIEDSSEMCIKLGKEKCQITKRNLSPQTTYNFKFILYTPEKKEEITRIVETSPLVPHIIISEVMHTPEPSGTVEKNYEFVELYNNSRLDFDLNACLIDDKNDSKSVDPFLPLQEGETIIKAGETAVIIGSESTLDTTIPKTAHIFRVDDTTIADAGLAATESVQIICGGNETEIVAEYDGSIKTERGFSVIIETDGTMCESEITGGTPGIYSECQ